MSVRAEGSEGSSVRKGCMYKGTLVFRGAERSVRTGWGGTWSGVGINWFVNTARGGLKGICDGLDVCDVCTRVSHGLDCLQG